MVRKICLDTSFLIEWIKDSKQAAEAIGKLDGEFALTSITVFELLIGGKSEEKLSAQISAFPRLDFDSDSAEIASRIHKQLKARGMTVDMRDIFIAAICISKNFELLTLNKKHFERMSDYGLIMAE